MECSKQDKCKHNCYGKIPEGFDTLIKIELINVFHANNFHDGAIEKLNFDVLNRLDPAYFCHLVEQNIVNHDHPRFRHFDRILVYIFEVHYEDAFFRTNSRRSKFGKTSSFFDAVPRGECLNSFIDIIKNQCLGELIVEQLNVKLENIVADSLDGNYRIPWEKIHENPELREYLEHLTEVVFYQMKSGNVPIPAILNGIDSRYHPERINKILKLMYKIWHEDRQKELEAQVENVVAFNGK